MGFILGFWLRFNQNRHVRKVTGSKITACTFISSPSPSDSFIHTRLTLDPCPPVYATLSISYCAIQVIFLAAAWQANYGAGRLLEAFVQESAASPFGDGRLQYSYLDYKIDPSPQLRLCPGGISSADHGANCPVIWPKPSNTTNTTSQRGKRADSATVTFYPATGTLDVAPYDGLTVNGTKPKTTITLSSDCVQAIKWPYHQYVNCNRLSCMPLILL